MNTLSRILTIATLVSVGGLISSVLIQIYGRFFLSSAPVWTEEAARLFFVYTMSFAAGLALKDKEFVRLDFVYNRLNDKKKQIWQLSISLVTVSLFFVTAFWAVEYTLLGLRESSPSLGFSMSIAFNSILIMNISIAIYSMNFIVEYFKTSS